MSKIAEHSETIDGLTYTTTTFTADIGTPLFLEATPMFARLLSGDVANWAAGDAKKDAETLKRLVSGCTCSDISGTGQPGPVGAHFGSHFAGRQPHLINVAAWVFRINFQPS